jgi:hypothetical protein
MVRAESAIANASPAPGEGEVSGAPTGPQLQGWPDLDAAATSRVPLAQVQPSLDA